MGLGCGAGLNEVGLLLWPDVGSPGDSPGDPARRIYNYAGSRARAVQRTPPPESMS